MGTRKRIRSRRPRTDTRGSCDRLPSVPEQDLIDQNCCWPCHALHNRPPLAAMCQTCALPPEGQYRDVVVSRLAAYLVDQTIEDIAQGPVL